jgi:hypothetical protein
MLLPTTCVGPAGGMGDQLDFGDVVEEVDVDSDLERLEQRLREGGGGMQRTEGGREGRRGAEGGTERRRGSVRWGQKNSVR